jgi:hypothetical protein
MPFFTKNGKLLYNPFSPVINMKTQLFLYVLCSVSIFGTLQAQTSDEVLNLLLQKNLITQAEADSIKVNDEKKKQDLDKAKDRSFTIGLEFRPRAEYRNGYRYLREDTTQAAFQVLGRSRINITYEQYKKFKFHTSIQDIRTWGQYDSRSTDGTLQVFEAYAEAYLMSKFTARIGRQKIMLDNQRLFAQNDWRPNAGSHDGLSFHYTEDKFETSLYGVFNQSSSEIYSGTDFQPSWAKYKYLGVHYLKYKFKQGFTLTTINALDGFQDKKNIVKHYNRYTNGGRVEWANDNFYATFSGYYQWGENSVGKELEAWYIQPELKYTNKKFKNNVRLGLEVLSGSDGTNAKLAKDNSFEPLYGVAHRFNGYMDFFTSFPKDVNNAGLVNPYLFLEQELGKKFAIQAHFHLFYAQNKLVNAKKKEQAAYIGFENDYVLKYKPNKFTELEWGVSYANLTPSAAAMKQPGASSLDPKNKASNGGNPDLIPTFSYLSIKFNPELFKAKF